MNHGIERRAFLKGALAAGSLAAGAAAAGCAPSGTGSSQPMAQSGSSLRTADSVDETWSFEIAPDPIPEDQIAEIIEAELIVVGAGTSGLMTAASAAEEGVDVVVVSASAKPVARGGSNSTVYCKAMKDEGYDPIPLSSFQKEIFHTGNQVDQRKWYKHYNHSEEAMNWAINLMEKAGYRAKVEMATPDEPSSLYLQSCSIGWDYGENSEIDPDLPSVTGMMQPLLVKELARFLTEDLGSRIDFKTKAEQLVRDDNNTGRVSAVICSREDGSFVKYVGKKAIVLATGDFSANRDMMYRYAPTFAPYIDDAVYDAETDYDAGFKFGGLFKGDGQRMGLWVGAGWQKIYPNCAMACFNSFAPCNLYRNFLGLLVNIHGERFMNEDCLGPCASMNYLGQPQRSAFALWGASYAGEEATSGSWNNDTMIAGDADAVVKSTLAAWDESVAQGVFVKADTLEEVISQLGLPPETIETVKRYDEFCKNGNDEDFHKAPTHLHPFGDGPYYGSAMRNNLMNFLTILGGLNTDGNMRVCDENDEPIPGLYNVGTMVGDMFATNYTYMIEGGNYGANCITFGYLTGKYIAENE